MHLVDFIGSLSMQSSTIMEDVCFNSNVFE